MDEPERKLLTPHQVELLSQWRTLANEFVDDSKAEKGVSMLQIFHLRTLTNALTGTGMPFGEDAREVEGTTVPEFREWKISCQITHGDVDGALI